METDATAVIRPVATRLVPSCGPHSRSEQARVLGSLCGRCHYAAFASAAWATGLPIDVMICSDFNVFNVLFLQILLGNILEGRVALLHLGPPCSSFSRALNRFISKHLRSWLHPDGLPDVSAAAAEKVAIGNALAEIAVRLALAQVRAHGWNQLEQPSSSPMMNATAFSALWKDVPFFRAEAKSSRTAW